MYLSGEKLDRRFNPGATKQVKSGGWKAQKGRYEITAVVFPLAYLDPKGNPSWDEYDERYVIAEDSMAYDHTRLPNLFVEDVQFSEDPVPGADALHLDIKITIANEAGPDGIRPASVDEPFYVLIRFEEGTVCPLHQGPIPCTKEIKIDRLGSGSTVTRTVHGGFPVPLPRSGDAHRYVARIVVDPDKEVDESYENDNERRGSYKVTN